MKINGVIRDQTMAPDFCADHGQLMRSMGAIEQGQADQCREIKEIKKLLEKLTAQIENDAKTAAEEKAKSSLLYWGLGTAGVAAISAGTHWLINKICGQ
jgi:hypothetical protein